MSEGEFQELFLDPVRWAEAFLKDPTDPEKSLVLRSYQKDIIS